tara:strand:- start:1236 stop:1628 length:393 start_codon:yes stop_codon:yes gene_type:complete
LPLVGIYLGKTSLPTFLKYYTYISLFYILELMIFFLLKDILANLILLNFIIRFIFVVLTSYILKNFVFKGDGYFYTIFYLIALLNPIGSSLILYILNSFILKSLLLGKFVSDVIVSLISFSIINLLNKNK